MTERPEVSSRAESPTEPPRHRFLHESLPVPCQQHRSVAWQLLEQARMPEEHDQVGARGMMSQRLAGSGSEA
jgi:hypothetical protein